MILLCLIGQPTCLTWTPYGIYGIFSRERWETVNPTIQTSWRLNSAPHTSLMLSFVLKEPRPSIECINEHTLKNFNCSVLQILFLLILGNILIFWDTGFLKVKVKMEWRSNDEAFGIWHRIFSQRQRETNLLQHADNGIAYSCFHLFPLYFSCGPYILKK